MRKSNFIIVLLISLLYACTKENHVGTAILRLAIEKDSYTRANNDIELIDTANFILEIKKHNKTVYNDIYGRFPEKMTLEAGRYSISIKSSNNKAAAFSKPIYGDSQDIELNADEDLKITLSCRLINAAIKLKIAPSFLRDYPEGIISLESKYGKIKYNYRETRLAYFPAGRVDIFLLNNDKKTLLLSKILRERDVSLINISSKAQLNKYDNKAISLEIDTSKIWSSYNYVIGEKQKKDKGIKIDKAVNIAEARGLIGSKKIWVYGYIVGCLKTSHLISSEPFTSSSNIAIASRQNIEDKDDCIAVELRKKSLKSAINLEDNPYNLYKKIFIKGDIVESYYGTIGLKNCTEYRIE